MYNRPPDKYDSPAGDIEIVDDSPIGMAKDTASAAGDMAKKYWILVVALLVVVGIGYVAFDFFIGSIKTIDFNVTDTEGKPLAATVKVLNGDGKEIARAENNDAVSIRKGNYTVKAAASGGYKTVQESITVEEDKTIDLKIEKNWNLDLSAELPDQLVQGEKRIVNVAIENKGNEDVETGLVLEGEGFSSSRVSYTYQKPVFIPAGQVANVELEILVKAEAKIGEELKGALRIEGLDNPNAKATKEFQLLTFNASKINVSPTTISLAVKEGAIATKTITLENKNEYPLNDVQLNAIILTNQYTEIETVGKWIEFSEQTISIGPREKKVINLNVKPVIGESAIPEYEDEEKISGNIVISNSFYRKEIPLNITLSKAKVGISISDLRPIRIDPVGSTYPSKSQTMKIKNTGDFPVSDIIVSSTGSDACRLANDVDVPLWIRFRESQFDLLQSGSEMEIVFYVEPSGGKAGDVATCRITVRFFNPRLNDREAVISDLFSITLGT